ncbi:TolC family outer membrane protein [Lutimaribacter saemankumensis]|uniref:Outer membrane protein n=1 Tax=Lutimaribacter saemankumensis TaxID=490829 RepID=A0A1G8IJ67_9RHOB|nr:TolC family outer membrane protein [Lutimaribacter saemankumensis]SDI19098.1 outer membrane protein [Lutimaribacter saemankumensis]
MSVSSRIRTKAIAGIAGLCLAVATPLAVRAESLADAMAEAYRSSGLLEQNRAVLRAADEDVAIAVSTLRPVVRWLGDVTRRFGDSATGGLPARNIEQSSASLALSAELLLWDGGRSKMDLDIAKESVLAVRQALIGVEQRVLLAAVEAFMDVRSSYEIVTLRRNNIRVITEELRAARDRFEVGEVTRTDVALAQARLAQARSNLAQAEGDLAIAIEAYRAAVGRAPGNLTQPPVMKMPARSVEAAKSVAERTHPDLRRLQFEVSATELGVLKARAATNPQVTLRGQIGVTESFDSTDFTESGSIGIEAGGVIYQGGQLRALARKAMAQRDAKRAELLANQRIIAQNVGTAFARVQVAQAALAAVDEQIRAARVAFRGVREEAALGARTTLDVLNAEQELLDAQANRITAASNEYKAYYGLLSAMGLLTVENLKLNVPQYDPTAYYNMVKDAPSAVSEQGRKLDRVLQKLGKQ